MDVDGRIGEAMRVFPAEGTDRFAQWPAIDTSRMSSEDAACVSALEESGHRRAATAIAIRVLQSASRAPAPAEDLLEFPDLNIDDDRFCGQDDFVLPELSTEKAEARVFRVRGFGSAWKCYLQIAKTPKGVVFRASEDPCLFEGKWISRQTTIETQRGATVEWFYAPAPINSRVTGADLELLL